MRFVTFTVVLFYSWLILALVWSFKHHKLKTSLNFKLYSIISFLVTEYCLISIRRLFLEV